MTTSSEPATDPPPAPRSDPRPDGGAGEALGLATATALAGPGGPGGTGIAGSLRPHPAPLGRSAARGFVWQTGAAVTMKVVSVLSNLVLAKILLQEDFGAVALAYSVTFLGATLANAGVSDVLIQRQARLHLWINPGFWMSLTCGVAGALVTLLLAPIAALAFDDPRLIGLIVVIALGIPLQNFATVPDAILVSRLRFRLVATLALVAAVVQTALTLLFAWIGFGAYSFVLPPPLVALAVGLVKWSLAAPPVRLALETRRWRYLVGDSSAVFGVRLLSNFLGQADYIILGYLYSTSIVGSYYFAYNLAAQFARLAITNFNSVLYPTLSRLQDHPQRQVDATLRTARMIVTFCVPLCFMQAAAAGPGEQLLFGGKWKDAVPIMQVLSVGLGITSAGWVTESFLRSMGQFKFYFKFVACSTPVIVVAIALGAWFGAAIGTAVAIVLAWAILHLVGLAIALRRQLVPLSRLLRIYAVPLPAAIVATAAALVAAHLLNASPLAELAAIVAIITVGYSLLLRWLAPDALTELKSRLLRA